MEGLTTVGDVAETLALLAALWRERQRLLDEHAGELLSLPPAQSGATPDETLHALLSREPCYLGMSTEPEREGAACAAEAEPEVHALHVHLSRLDAAISMLRGAEAISTAGSIDDESRCADRSIAGRHTSKCASTGDYPLRPYLSLHARKRLRQGARNSSASLPMGADGRVVAPRLCIGDVLHVPFSPGEAAACERLAAQSPVSPMDVATFAMARSLVPGRDPVDCARFWASERAPRHICPLSRESCGDGQTYAKTTGHFDHAHARLSSLNPSESCADPAQSVLHVSDQMLAVTRTARTGERNAVPKLLPSSLSLHRLVDQLPITSASMAAAHLRSCGITTGVPWSRDALLWRGLYRTFCATSVSTRPTGSVVDMAFSAEGSSVLRLAVGTNGVPHEALLYDLTRGTSRILGDPDAGSAHGAIVSSVRFTSSSRRVVTAGYDHTVRVWSASNGRLIRVLGTSTAAGPQLNADEDATMVEGGEVSDSNGQQGAVQADGDIIEAQEEDGQASTAQEPTIGDVVQDEARDEWEYLEQLDGHTDHVLCLCTHGWNESLAASGGKDDTIILWNLEEGKARFRLELDRNPLDLTFGRAACEGSLFGALDSRHMEGGQAVAFDVTTGQCRYRYSSSSSGHVSCIHCAEDGATFLVGAADGSVRQHVTHDGTLAFHYETGMPDVNVVSVSCDGRYIQASGDQSQTVVLDARRPDRALHILEHNRVAQHVNGVSAQWCHHARTILVTGSDDSLMRVWDVSLGGSQPIIASFPGHAAPISCLAISPDDALLVSGGDDGKIVAFSTRGICSSDRMRYSVGSEQCNFLRGR